MAAVSAAVNGTFTAQRNREEPSASCSAGASWNDPPPATLGAGPDTAALSAGSAAASGPPVSPARDSRLLGGSLTGPGSAVTWTATELIGPGSIPQLTSREA